jgi:hypothetical protein
MLFHAKVTAIADRDPRSPCVTIELMLPEGWAVTLPVLRDAAYKYELGQAFTISLDQE